MYLELLDITDMCQVMLLEVLADCDTPSITMVACDREDILAALPISCLAKQSPFHFLLPNCSSVRAIHCIS